MYVSCLGTYPFSSRLTALARIRQHQPRNPIITLEATPIFLDLLRWGYIHYTSTISFTNYNSLITLNLTLRELLAHLIKFLTKSRITMPDVSYHSSWRFFPSNSRPHGYR